MRLPAFEACILLNPSGEDLPTLHGHGAERHLEMEFYVLGVSI